jgi:hypothetical protein
MSTDSRNNEPGRELPIQKFSSRSLLRIQTGRWLAVFDQKRIRDFLLLLESDAAALKSFAAAAWNPEVWAATVLLPSDVKLVFGAN